MLTVPLDVFHDYLPTPDTVSDVIHDAAQRPSRRRRGSIVDNSAKNAIADVNKLSAAQSDDSSAAKVPNLSPASLVPIPNATTRSRSPDPEPSRLFQRSPVRDAAPVTKSERTPPPSESSRRGPRIRSTPDRPGAWGPTPREAFRRAHELTGRFRFCSLNVPDTFPQSGRATPISRSDLSVERNTLNLGLAFGATSTMPSAVDPNSFSR